METTPRIDPNRQCANQFNAQVNTTTADAAVVGRDFSRRHLWTFEGQFPGVLSPVRGSLAKFGRMTWVRQDEPLLQGVDAQQGLDSKRRTSALGATHRYLRSHQRHPSGPGHHQVDPLEECPLRVLLVLRSKPAAPRLSRLPSRLLHSLLALTLMSLGIKYAFF